MNLIHVHLTQDTIYIKIHISIKNSPPLLCYIIGT